MTEQAQEFSRRTFFRRAAACTGAIGIGVPAAAAAYSLYEARNIQLRYMVIKAPHWNTDPLRFLFLTDMHIGCPDNTPERMAELLRLIEGLKADAVFYGGDFLNTPAFHWRTDNDEKYPVTTNGMHVGAEAAADIFPKVTRPTFAVLGNHDWYHDPQGMLARHLCTRGIAVLENDAAIFNHAGKVVTVVGVRDEITRNVDINGAFTAAAAFGNFENCVFLAHRPGTIASLAPFLRQASGDTSIKTRLAVPALALFGHTHGGQLNLPGMGRFTRKFTGAAPLSYMHGLNTCKIGNTPLQSLTSAGIGTSVAPVRIGRPPEIHLIEISHGVPELRA